MCKISEEANIVTFKAHENEITCLKWDPRGILFATTSADLSCKVWLEKEDSVELLHTMINQHEPVALEWSPLIGKNGQLLIVVGTAYGSVCAWTLYDSFNKSPPQLVMQNQGHCYDPITCLSVHPNGMLLASGSLKRPSGVMNIWSLHDGCLVHTTPGSGGVNINGLTWTNGNSIAVAFSRSKTVSIIQHNLNDYIENSALITARCALIKKGINGLRTAPFFKALIMLLPKIIQEQYHSEKLSVQIGVQLMHSVYLKSLASLALLLELDNVICYPIRAFNDKLDEEIVADFQWLETFSSGARLADSLIKRTNLPRSYSSHENIASNNGDSNDDGDAKPLAVQNTFWSIKQDEQIMQWVRRN